jgi:hypothetical protein
MTKIKAFLQANHAPLALLTTCLIAFGLLSPALGFFQDDWHFIYYAQHGLDKLWELSAYDNRPFASWPYIAGFALFGVRPLAWQIAVILLRWLTAVAFWLVFRSLWPKHEKLVVVPALLFAVYPLYTLQPMAVTYITHWVAYLFYALSFWLMILAIRDIKRLWPLLLLSVALDGLQLFTIEYFNGIELLRPIILWMALSAPQADSRSRFKSVTWTWLPYLGVLAAFVFWRGFVFQSPAADNNAPTVLRDLVSAPLPTLIYLITAGLKDTLLIQIGAWSETLSPDLVDFSPAGLAILFASALSFIGFYFYFKRLDLEEAAPVRQMLLLGALGLILGPIPAWVTRQPLYDTNPLWNSRLGMAAMFGAGLVIMALVEWLARTKHQRVIVYSLLLALSIGHLLRSENNYRHAWEAQVNFLNQLAWRAPSIEAGTAFVSEGELLSYMGDYPTAFAINMVYNQPKDSTRALTWFFPSYGDDPIAEKMLSGGTLREVKFSTRFEGDATDSLVIWYDPSVSACLHVLTPLDAESRLYSDYLKQLAPNSALERISQDSNVNTDFFAQALVVPKGWCYYYQKAELAEQYGQSANVIELWKTAQGEDLHPSHGMEYLPFIRAYLSTEDYARAQALTESASRLTSSQAMRQTLCRPWLEVGETGAGPRSEMTQLLKCE